jgi:hypothetical protein
MIHAQKAGESVISPTKEKPGTIVGKKIKMTTAAAWKTLVVLLE